MTKNILLIIFSPFTAWVPLLKIFKTYFKNPIRFQLNAFNLSLLVIFFWSLLSGIYNKSIFSILASLVLILYFGLSVWTTHYLTTYERIHRLFREVWVISLIPASIGLIEKVVSYFINMNGLIKLFWNPTYFPTMENYRIMSTFGNPNVAGDWFGIMSLLSFYFLDHIEPSKRKMVIVGNTLFICSFVLTGSKGAMAAYIIATFTFAILKHSKNVWKLLIYSSLILGSSVFLFSNLFETFNSRNLIWQACYEIIKKMPVFGCGFMGIYPRIHEVHGHNLFISVTTSLGLAGLIIIGLITNALVVNSIRLYRKNVRMMPILMSIEVFLFVHSMVDFTILAPQIGSLFILISSIIFNFSVVYLNEPSFMFDSEKLLEQGQRKQRALQQRYSKIRS